MQLKKRATDETVAALSYDDWSPIATGVAGDPPLGHNFAQLQVQPPDRATSSTVLSTAEEVVVQRQALDGATGVGPRLNLLDPALLRGAATAALDEGYAPVRAWLQDNRDQLQMLSVAGIAARLRRQLPAAVGLSDAELAALIEEWAATEGVALPRVSLLPEPGEPAVPSVHGTRLALPDNALIDLVKQAISLAVNGVKLKREHGRANLAASGMTIELFDGDLRASGKVNVNGSFGFSSSFGPVHFGAELSAERWELKLSLGDEPELLESAELAEIFQRGEAALRQLAVAAVAQGGLASQEALLGAVEEQIEPLKAAIDTLGTITEANQPRVGASISLGPLDPAGSPDSPPGSNPAAGGIELKASITIQF